MSDVTDLMVEKHAESLVNVTVLDISYCLKITYKGLEAFGKHCKSLIHLKRNMPPPAWETPTKVVASKIDDREAMIIAGKMMGLHHLELGFGHFGDYGLDAIFTKCKALTHLDIQGCWSVELEGDLEDKCERLVVFKSPWFDDYDNRCSSDNDSSGADAGEETSSSDSD
uniref:Putative F-box protein FBW2-like n=1 Tax=Davidia involucrata TaxID=16924 RepID=A0A5B7B6F1_DAVIN